MTAIIQSIMQNTDNIAQGFVINGYASLAQTYRSFVMTLLAIMIAFIGLNMAFGWVKVDLPTIIKRVLIAAIVAGLALNWAFFCQWMYDLFTKAPDQIATHIVQAIPGSTISDTNSIYGSLDDAFNVGMKGVTQTWSIGSIGNLLPYFMAMFLAITTIISTGFALFELILAKLGLASLLVLSPLAIPMVLFQPTKELFFNGWFRHVVGFALIPIFVITAVTLNIILFKDYTQGMLNILSGHNLSMASLPQIAAYLLSSVISIFLIYKAAHLATSIAGSLSTALSQAAASLGFNKLKNTMSSTNTSTNNTSNTANSDTTNNNNEPPQLGGDSNG